MDRRKTWALILALLLLAGSMGVAHASQEPVRVGFFAFSGYHEMDGEGRRSGYGYDFLQKLASCADWTYEYLGYDATYSEALEMLRRGEVDVVTSVSKTPERQKEFLFSKLPIGTNATMMTVKAGNQDVEPGVYSTYQGLTVGMLEGNSKNANFDAFAQSHGFTYTPVYYGAEADLAAALQAGEVQAAVSGSLRATENEWVVESFDASNFYIITRLDQTELMAQIDHAIEMLTLREPDWRTTLHEKYYAADSGGQVMIGADERTYLDELTASDTPLTVLVNPDRAPYSYLEDGQIRGILPDVFDLLAQRLGIRYTFIPAQDRAAYYELRGSGTADLVLDFSDDYFLAEEEGYKISQPYMDISFARLNRSNFSGKAKTIATVAPSDALSAFVTQRYPDRRILYYDEMDQCVQAVLSGEADGAVLYSYSIEQVIRQDRRGRLSFALLGDENYAYTIGVNSQKPHQLLSLLNRAIDSLSSAQVNDIIVNQTDNGRTRRVNLLDFLYANPLYGLLAAFFLTTFIFVFVLLIQRTRNQHKLKERVDEVSRNYEAQQKKLSDALALADQANRAKTTFLNNMSHDIRTPMNAIIGYTALATTHLDNREQTQDYLAKIAQSSNHLLSLINDVLDMSRIESGHVHVENRPENLAEILHGLRNIVQADIHAKRLEFSVNTMDIVNEDIFCDKLRLNQILLNLLSNAIKFTEPGGSISLCVAQRDTGRADGALYEFRVKDTGIGMSPEFAQHIFEPFTRERNSTVSGIQGTGLGMAITYNIVEMMGGTIRVESQQHVGTEFIVELNFDFCAPQQPEKVSVLHLDGLRALVADDDLVCCQSVAKMLRQIGMRAEWTRYGKEAVIRAGEAHEMADPFAVYIIDWSMPDQNGVETVRGIRRAVGEEAPIILLSAYDWADIEQEARDAGVTDFVSKPLFFSELHRVLERAMGQAQAQVPETVLQTEDSFMGRRVLLVEDNELNREIATELLNEAGFKVECAENGQIALDRVAGAQPGEFDLILMDVQMPVMNGYEATMRIRQLENPALAHIPVIAMTANAFEEDKQQAAKAGMDGYLPKPIDIDKMFRLLRETLQKSERSRNGEVK